VRGLSDLDPVRAPGGMRERLQQRMKKQAPE
jgi:hypothetical protein